VQEEAASEQSSPGMARALERILQRRPSPEILDLGQACGATAVYLAGRGARVSVEEFVPPPPGPAVVDPERDAQPQPLVLEQPEGKFDLVLAWEHFDFVPPDRLDEFVSEIWRVMALDGWLLLFSLDGSPATQGQGRPSSYRVTADDRLMRESAQGPLLPRWSHHNRAMHQALAPLKVVSVTLRRNRVREFLVRKPAH
jgi:cyclopropane fatty-acyl-phospholipid synthase-like methyltransferase